MTQLENQRPTSAHIPGMETAIPMTSRCIGSWEVLISRRPLSSADLASRHHAVSGNWERTVRRFQLETAHQETPLVSQPATGLTRIGPKARILDCGVWTDSLSIDLDGILKGPVDYHGIDTSAEMLVLAKPKMQHAGLRSHLKLADVRSLPYDDQSFDVVMVAYALEHLPDPRSKTAWDSVPLRDAPLPFRRTWAITKQPGVA